MNMKKRQRSIGRWGAALAALCFAVLGVLALCGGKPVSSSSEDGSLPGVSPSPGPWAAPLQFFYHGNLYCYHGRVEYSLPAGFEFVGQVNNVAGNSKVVLSNADFDGNADGYLYIDAENLEAACFQWKEWDTASGGREPYLICALEPEVSSAPPEPPKQSPAKASAPDAGRLVPPGPSFRQPKQPELPAATHRLVFPSERVFTCEAGYSSIEEPIRFSKDGVENGWISYDKSLVPFSDDLLEHPDASLLMLCGVHEYMLESWEIPLNDGWVCYMYRGEMDHAAATFDPGGRGTIYCAMIGRPGDESVFCLHWINYIETPVEEPLESFHEGDPGYVSIEDMRSFLSGITVEEDA